VRAFVQELVLADCDRVIPYCLALLPRQNDVALGAYLEELSRIGYFGHIEAMVPGPRPEHEAALEPRFRAVALQLAEILSNPESRVEVPPVDVDLFRAWVNDMPRQPGVRCREIDCTEEAISLSVYCPAHHYEQIQRTKASCSSSTQA
jgi:hypothetical protein